MRNLILQSFSVCRHCHALDHVLARRPVSTTSAINRGLRATKDAAKSGGRITRDRPSRPEGIRQRLAKPREEGSRRRPSLTTRTIIPRPPPTSTGTVPSSLDDRLARLRAVLVTIVKAERFRRVPTTNSNYREAQAILDGLNAENGRDPQASFHEPLQQMLTELSLFETDPSSRGTTIKVFRSPSGRYRLRPGTRPDADYEHGGDDVPIPLPFTTAASQFLYGSNTVMAAMKARRRTLYHLYIHPSRVKRESASESRTRNLADDLIALAKQANVPHTIDPTPALLDRMSEDRPHNGVVLEASKLPAPSVLGLGKPEPRTSRIPLTLQPQSAEDVAIHGAPRTLHAATGLWRRPLVVLLDGITDPGNVGNIIRTCHFYGVDAVGIATNTCASLTSAVLAKASSGACEAVQILSLPQPSNFVYESARAGWKIYAAVAPDPAPLLPSAKDTYRQRTVASIARASPLARHPCVLMLGAEGEGLRENLRNRADFLVTIEKGHRHVSVPDVGVDSMNVGVAAGVLLDAFMRKPDPATAGSA